MATAYITLLLYYIIAYFHNKDLANIYKELVSKTLKTLLETTNKSIVSLDKAIASTNKISKTLATLPSYLGHQEFNSEIVS